jgi:hypothetical protein
VNDNTFRRNAARGVAALLLTGTLVGLGAGIASAAQPGTAQPGTPATPAVSVASAPSPSQAKGITALTLVITNNTDQTLTLQNQLHSGHYQQQPTDLGPYASETVSVYSNTLPGAQLWVLYGLPDGNSVQFSGSVPQDGKDGVTASTNDPAYVTTAGPISGWHPTVAMGISNAS